MTSTDLNADLFRYAMTCFASSITAITTNEAGQPSGIIATSVCSLSADPATILVCINKTASSHDIILRTGIFAVNLLSEAQVSVANRFNTSKGQDRFEPALWTRDNNRPPKLIDAVVVFDCDLIAVHDGFTHSIMVGHIADASINEGSAADCLLWHRHGFAKSTAKTMSIVL